jgi:hypothetical protein
MLGGKRTPGALGPTTAVAEERAAKVERTAMKLVICMFAVLGWLVVWLVASRL